MSVHTIGSGGALAAITGSPFIFTSAGSSSVGVLSPDNKVLFVSNDIGNEITSLDVAQGPNPAPGTLTQEAGSPTFNSPGGSFPEGIGTNRKGTLLYAVNAGSDDVSAFQVNATVVSRR